MQIPFVGESYAGRDDKQETINLYPEINPLKRIVSLYNTPGLKLFTQLGGGPCRGLHVVSADETKLYAVHSNKFRVVNNDGTLLDLGTIGTTEGLVGMADNGFEIVIVDGSIRGYIYNLSTKAFTEIPSFPGGETIVFVDGYFISSTPNSQKLWCSDLYDGMTWNALNVAEAEGDPDNILQLTTNHKELVIHGTLSSEIWYNAAFATGFPFTRMPGGIVEYGIGAKWSVASSMNSLYMVARTAKQGERVIVRISGYVPQIISSPGINYQLSKQLSTADFESFAYTEEGHSFIVWSSTSGDLTIVYDATTNMWHRRKSYGMGRWRASRYAYFNNKHIVGDCLNGNLYQLDMNTCTDNGDPIERIRIAQELIDDESYDRIFVNELQLNMELGLGNDQIEDPQATLQISKDNGKTWGNEHFQPLMKRGEFRKRLMWHRLGMARRRLFKLTITDPVKVVIRGAWVDAEKGTA